MGFEKTENSITFCLLTLIILFAIAEILLLGNWFTIPLRGEDPNYIYGYNYMNDVVYKPVPDFWVISFEDHKITNIEHIIIWICFLWGFLRIIDLERILGKYKKD